MSWCDTLFFYLAFPFLNPLGDPSSPRDIFEQGTRRRPSFGLGNLPRGIPIVLGISCCFLCLLVFLHRPISCSACDCLQGPQSFSTWQAVPSSNVLTFGHGQLNAIREGYLYSGNHSIVKWPWAKGRIFCRDCVGLLLRICPAQQCCHCIYIPSRKLTFSRPCRTSLFNHSSHRIFVYQVFRLFSPLSP